MSAVVAGFFAGVLQLLDQYGGLIAKGVVTMLALAGVMVVCGGLLAIVLTAIRMIPLRLCRALVAVFVMYHRNVPMVVQMLFWYFGLSQLLPAGLAAWVNQAGGEFIYAAIALSLAYGAYVGQDLYSGIRALPPGQIAAARALGLNFYQRLRYVVLPQALRTAMPPIFSQTLLFFKATSLAATIGVAELAHVSKEINNETFRSFEIFFVSTGIYVVLSMLVLWACARVERRVKAAWP